MTTTPNMSLILPDVSVTAGPMWATMLNTAYSVIDSHDHSTGQGVKITPSGLNISSDLSFVQNNATNLRTARLFNNTTFTPGINDLTALYAVSNELFYRDGAGNVIQVTAAGSLNVSGNITNIAIKDTNFTVQYFGDITKQFRFNVSAIPTATTRILSIPDSGANDTFVTQNATQVISNKTVTTSILSGNTAATLISGSGTLTLPTSGVITIPNGTDTLVSKTSTDVLSNKSETGPLPILAATTVQFNNSANTFSTSIKAGANVSNATFSLPIADGTSGQAVVTNGSGILSFANPSAAAATVSTPGSITRETVWTSYTPTVSAGFGTISNLGAFYKVLGDTLFVNIYFVNGTSTAAIGSISIPSGFIIDSTKVPISASIGNPGVLIGEWSQNSGSLSGNMLAYTGTSTSLVYISNVFGSTSLQNASSVTANTNNGVAMGFKFEVPIV
jgi:hypothetical protein